MKTNIEEISSVKKRLNIEIEVEEVDKKFIEAYQILRKSAGIPGFRKGKVPQNLLEKYYGNRVIETVTRDLVNDTLGKAFEETGIIPINAPLIENETAKSGQPFHYSAITEVRPRFELKNYNGLEIEKEIIKVTDADLNRQLDEIRKGNGKLTNITEARGARKEDYVVLQYESFEDHKPLPGLKADNFLLRLGNNEFHPDFEKGLLGLKAGEQAEIRVDFEKEYEHKQLAGKNVLFKVKVLDIKTLEVPELNDEFVKSLGTDLTDVESFRNRVKEQLRRREEDRIDTEMKQRLLNTIAQSVDFELPESLLESEVNLALENFKRTLLRSGSSIEKTGLPEERLLEKLRPPAAKRVKNFLILAEIAKQNKLQVEEKDLEEGFEQLAKSMNQEPKMVRQFYESQNMLASFRIRLLEEKTLKYLVENAKIKEVEAEKLASEQS